MLKSHFPALMVAFLCITLVFAPDAEAKKRSRSSKKNNVVSAASGVSDQRYAAIIMNPVTGEIYHQQDADSRRYPASLTKMMTIYLLFEALDKGKATLEARMDVSELAARQPQTNLALKVGDSITVETAIKALVVRSANDVAVVVAEALGGDVDGFAQMMTARARALGMNNTVFKNPNGLPNAGQVTTARDMAKLGIALKRDFPVYYRYFSTRQFSHDGVTYYTHNRVMLRYAGTDGIKTGYVGASGFNLVTSVVRGGRPLVGVVMGGASGVWRDNRMIALLDAGYRTLASRGAARGRISPANLPLPGNGVRKDALLRADSPFAAAGMASSPTESANPPVSEGERIWGIQVGAFSSRELAEQALRGAMRIAAAPLVGAKVAPADNSAGSDYGTPVHRARVDNLLQEEAKTACDILVSAHFPCFIFQAKP